MDGPVQPPFAGLVARRPGLDDVPAVLALMRSCDVAVIGRTDATLAQVEADVAAPQFDRERGGLLVEDAAGAAVGWLWTEDDAEAARVFVDPYALDPALLAWLLAQGVAYAGQLAAQRGRPVEISAGSWESDGDLGGALAAAGFDVRRKFWRMRVDLAGSGWPVPVPSKGVTVRNPAPDLEATFRLLHHLVETSMAGHWQHVARSYEGWRAQFDASSGRDPAQWWVADVDGDPAAVLIGDDSRLDLGMAWVRTLGVLAQYRGRGLGKLLLRQSFAAAAARGLGSVGLSVDTENATGATRLYESVGMRPESVLLAWGRQVGG